MPQISTSQLSAGDHMEIRDLISEYSLSLDSGLVEGWVGLFTEDGSLTDVDGRSWVGRSGLTDFMAKMRARPEIGKSRHWVNNVVVTPTDTGAQSYFYSIQIEKMEAGFRISALSAVADDLQKYQGKWRIRARRISPWPVWNANMGPVELAASGHAPGELSAADRMQIQQLFARYNYAEDTGQVDGWVDTFTTNGSFADRRGQVFRGAGKLAGFALERGARPDLGQYLHWTNNVVVTPTEQGAQASSHIMLVEKKENGFGIRSMSAKADELRKEDGQWRFHSRKILPWPVWERGQFPELHSAMSLPIIDRQEGHELVSRSFLALDLGEIESWVGLFTSDGRLTGPDGRSWTGANELAGFAGEQAQRPDARTRLHGINVFLTPTQQGARSQSYCLKVEKAPGGCQVCAMWLVTDDLQFDQGRWRIRTRRIE